MEAIMNNSFYMSTRNEIEKLSARKKYWALPVLAICLSVSAVWALSSLKNNTGILPVDAAQFPILILGWFTGLILPLFIAMAAADLFSGELGERTLKIALLQPITRFKLFMSKLAAIAAYIVFSLGFVLVISVLASLLLGVDLYLTQTLTAYVSAIVPMLLIGIAAAFIAQFFKSSSSVLVFSILAFIASKTLAVIFPGIADAFITTYTNWYMLWISGTPNVSKMIILFMFMLSYSIILLTSGYCLFDRKEL
jgi:ABC-2 type transport system permease protein